MLRHAKVNFADKEDMMEHKVALESSYERYEEEDFERFPEYQKAIPFLTIDESSNCSAYSDYLTSRGEGKVVYSGNMSEGKSMMFWFNPNMYYLFMDSNFRYYCDFKRYNCSATNIYRTKHSSYKRYNV